MIVRDVTAFIIVGGVGLGGDGEVVGGLAVPVGVEEEHAVVQVHLAVVGGEGARLREPELGLGVASFLQ